MIIEGFLAGCILTSALNIAVYNYYNSNDQASEKALVALIIKEQKNKKE